jgi:hypothetical protein
MNNCFRHVFAFRKSRIGDLLFFPIHLPDIVLSTQFAVNGEGSVCRRLPFLFRNVVGLACGVLESQARVRVLRV